MLSTDIEQYQLYDKQSVQKFIPELTSLINENSKSNDKLAANYKDINFDNFLNYSIIVFENKIVAFSSILNRNYWPSNVARIFNRFWRNKNYSWSNPTFGILSQLMYDHQVEYCKEHGFDFVFLSTEKTPRHLIRWSQQANQYDYGWLMCDEKKRVSKKEHEGLQHIIYKNLTDTKESFPL